MSITYIGIDNGLDGGIAVARANDLQTIPMPVIKTGKKREINIDVIFAMIIANPDAVVCIEQAQKFAAGVLSLCSTWYSYGQIIAALKISDRRYYIVNPKDWQDMFWTRPKMPKGKKFDTKAAALQAALRLWPKHDWTKSDRASKPHDGMVDAALIAEWARRSNL